MLLSLVGERLVLQLDVIPLHLATQEEASCAPSMLSITSSKTRKQANSMGKTIHL